MRGTVLGLLLLASVSASAFQAPQSLEHVRDPLFNRALGVDCSHCHVLDQWTD